MWEKEKVKSLKGFVFGDFEDLWKAKNFKTSRKITRNRKVSDYLVDGREKNPTSVQKDQRNESMLFGKQEKWDDTNTLGRMCVLVNQLTSSFSAIQ